MQRALATSMIGIMLGWGGLVSLPGYKPYVSEDGYKPYVTTTGYKPYGYKPGYKPYLSGKGYKPYVKPKYVAPPTVISRPLKSPSCLDNPWILAALPGVPLTFCMVDAPIEPGGTY